MNLKWYGAFCVIIGCSSFAAAIGMKHRKEIDTLEKLLLAMIFIKTELEFHLTALPQLCRMTAAEVSGKIRTVFRMLAEEMEAQILPDASSCMHTVISQVPDLSRNTFAILKQLGRSLGRFDLPGQVQGIECAISMCENVLLKYSKTKDERIRSYQTIGLCAGAALIIVFI